MAIVGSAQVVIRALTENMNSDIIAGLRRAIPHFGRAGDEGGSQFGRNLVRRLRGLNLSDHVDTNRIRRTMARAGAASGRGLVNGLQGMIRSGGRGLQAAAGGMGRQIGKAFSGGFGKSGASKTFISMGLRIMALVPIIGALVGAISALVTGLFAIGAAAASASQSLIVLPSLLTAVIQGAAVALISFHGIGAALKAGMTAAKASTSEAAEDMKEKASDAAEAVSDAMEGLRDAQRNAARGVADAIEAISDAEEAHIDAIKAVTKAQEDLNDAREEAKERLIDLRFAAEGGALAERRAAMELADARWELNAASELPADNRLRMEAQLAYEEARLNLEMIAERNGDIAKEQKEAKKNGIEGSDEVVAAQEALKDANDAVKDSVEAITEAEQNLTRAREDGREAISDAREALSDALRAQREANEAMAAGSTEAQKYQEELAKLSPAARAFVIYLVSLRDEMKALSSAGQRGLFPGLQSAIQTLVTGLFPSLETMMFRTGQAVGKATKSIASDMTSGPFLASFGRVTEQNAVTIERLGKVTGDLVRIFFALLDGARPLINRFTKWFELWADGARKTVEAKNATGELTKTFNRAGNRMSVIIDIVKNLAEGFYDMGKIGDNQGMRLLRVFRRTTKQFADFTDKADNRKMLRKFFKDTADNVIKISSLVKVLGGAFLRLGASPAVGQISEALEPVVLNLEKMITSMMEKSGPALTEFLNSIILTFTELSESGALEIFLGILTGFFDTLTWALQLPVVGGAIKWFIAFGAALSAISLISRFPGLSLLRKGVIGAWGALVRSRFGQMIATNLRFARAAIMDTIKAKLRLAGVWIKSQLRMIKSSRAFMAVARAMRVVASLMFGPWGIAILAAGALFVILYKKVDWFRKGVDKLVDGIQWAFGKIVDAARWLWDVLFGHSIFPDLLAGFQVVFDGIGKVVKLYVDLVMFYVGLWVKFFTKVIAPVVLWLWQKAIRPAFAAIGRFIPRVWNNQIKPALRAMNRFFHNVLIPVIKFLWNKVVKPYFTLIAKLIRAYWNNIIKPALKAMWWTIDKVLIPVIKFLWNKIVKPLFTAIGNKVRAVWNDFIKPAFSAIRDFINDKLLPAFTAVKNGVVSMWEKIKNAAKAPVRFVIDTIYNKGIRKALNYIPGVDLDEATVPFAKGGVIPGYSPGRDIHKFYSPTAGMALNLSGGEAVMRPEFTRAMGGQAGIDRLNRLARTGRLREQSHASGGIVKINGEPMSAVAAKQLLLAIKLSGMGMRVMQGSYQPFTPFSGSSHTGGGVMDTSPGSFEAQRWLRKVGFAAWARNIPGAATAGSGAHVHSVSRIDPTSRNHPQLQSFARGENGLNGGPDYGPRPPLLTNLSKLLGGIDVSNSLITQLAGVGMSLHDLGEKKHDESEDHWWNVIGNVKDAIGNIKDGISTMNSRITDNEWYATMATGAKGAAHDAIDWINDKIPDKIEIDHFPDVNLPNNPIKNPFDEGGLARGAGWMPKDTIAPERVLSARQTQAFERLVDILDRKGPDALSDGPIQLSVQVPHDASPRDVVHGIVYEMQRMRRGGRYKR